MILGRESGGWATHGRVFFFAFQRQLAGYDPSDLKFDDAVVLSQTDSLVSVLYQLLPFSVASCREAKPIGFDLP